jgi:hypothetical protein
MRVSPCRWVLLLPILLVPSVARAGDAVAAEALFDEAKQLMADGRYAAACPKFAESQRIDPGLGTQFHLADCWQHVGRVASAWALFREIDSQARARGETGRERVARDRAAALEPFLPKLRIVPHESEAASGMTIQRDGVEVGREQYGVEVPMDPGTHVVTVTAPGRQAWAAGVEVPVEGKIVTVDVPPLSALPTIVVGVAPAPQHPAMGVPLIAPPPTAPPPLAPPPIAPPPIAPPPPAPPPAPSAPGVTSTMPPSETPVVENHGGAQRAVGWFLVGAGLVGVATGAYFGSQWLDFRNQSNPHCPGDVCDPTGSQLRDHADSQGRAAIIAGGGGVLAFIVGAALAATAPSPKVVPAPAARLQVMPIVDARRGGVEVQGAW